MAAHNCVSAKNPSSQDWQRLLQELDKIEDEEEQLSLKLSKLRKQKKFLKERAGKFLQSDVRSLEELEKSP
ncbi:hypothetical protein FQN50_005128 [Emmonsiellopsis sp. PD_5]|nr:hypothetical protein FQN50_005128 [Emmonsiellopsis sp. PD_5]